MIVGRTIEVFVTTGRLVYQETGHTYESGCLSIELTEEHAAAEEAWA